MCRPRPGARCSDKGKPVVWVAKQRGMTADAVEAERGAMSPRRKPPKKPSGRKPLTADAVAATYRAGVERPGDWLQMNDLRASLPGSRAEQDALLLDLYQQGRILLVQEADRASLTPWDRDAALHIDGTARHLLLLRED